MTANDGRYERGPQLPSDDEQMLTQQHAQFLRRWSTELGDRLADPVPERGRRRSGMALESWLASLLAVQMLIAGNGGDIHALADCDEWFTGAGFHPPRIVDVGRRSLLVASEM